MNVFYNNIFFSIVLHIFLLFVFLSILFWILISKQESNAMYRELDSVINNQLKNLKISEDLFTKNTYEYLKAYYSGENLTYEKNNNAKENIKISDLYHWLDNKHEMNKLRTDKISKIASRIASEI